MLFLVVLFCGFILQANATFAMVDRINEYAEKWLNVSAEIRQYLQKNTTEHNLKSIREVRTQPQVHHRGKNTAASSSETQEHNLESIIEVRTQSKVYHRGKSTVASPPERYEHKSIKEVRTQPEVHQLHGRRAIGKVNVSLY